MTKWKLSNGSSIRFKGDNKDIYKSSEIHHIWVETTMEEELEKIHNKLCEMLRKEPEGFETELLEQFTRWFELEYREELKMKMIVEDGAYNYRIV